MPQRKEVRVPELKEALSSLKLIKKTIHLMRSFTIRTLVEQAEKQLKHHLKGFGYESANAVMQTDINDPEVPLSYRETIIRPKGEERKRALMEEFNVLGTRGTWDLVQLPPGPWIIKTIWLFKMIKTKWVCDVKRNEHGKIERYKARLVFK